MEQRNGVNSVVSSDFVEIAEEKSHLQNSKLAPSSKPCHDSSPIESEDDAEPHLATVHLLVCFRHAIERVFLDHRIHVVQNTEFYRVL